MLTKNEVKAIQWALRRLRTCYADSLRALEKGNLVMISKENVEHYTRLQKLLKRESYVQYLKIYDKQTTNRH